MEQQPPKKTLLSPKRVMEISDSLRKESGLAGVGSPLSTLNKNSTSADSANAYKAAFDRIDEVPLCANGCGPMILKQGTKEGKEYRGWVCPIAKSGHPAKWMKIGADGHWVFQK